MRIRKVITWVIIFLCIQQSVIFCDERTDNFKKYCLENFAVKEIYIDEKDSRHIHVRLFPYKYTSKKNVQAIGEWIGRAYRDQVYGRGGIVIHIWDPYKSSVYTRAYVLK